MLLFERTVVDIVTGDCNRIRGGTLDGGEEVRSPVVINVAGPYSATGMGRR